MSREESFDFESRFTELEKNALVRQNDIALSHIESLKKTFKFSLGGFYSSITFEDQDKITLIRAYVGFRLSDRGLATHLYEEFLKSGFIAYYQHKTITKYEAPAGMPKKTFRVYRSPQRWIDRADLPASGDPRDIQTFDLLGDSAEEENAPYIPIIYVYSKALKKWRITDGYNDDVWFDSFLPHAISIEIRNVSLRCKRANFRIPNRFSPK